MWLPNVIGGLIIFSVGLIVRVFKLSNLLSGYNTLSNKEKEQYDFNKLCRYVGNILMLSSLILFLGAALTVIPGFENAVITISWLLFILFVLAGVVYLNSCNKFRKSEDSLDQIHNEKTTP